MKEYKGISLWDAGIVAGRIVNIEKLNKKKRKQSLPVFSSERDAFEYAKEEVLSRLNEMFKYTCRLAGEQNAAIFAVQEMILEDPVFSDEIIARIEEGDTAQSAIQTIANKWVEKFQNYGKESLFYERAHDITSLSLELQNVLSEENSQGYEGLVEKEEAHILLASIMTPAELMEYPREKIRGIVMQSPSIHSHVAILAKAMRIPTLMACDICLDDVEDGSYGMIQCSKSIFVLGNSEKDDCELQKRNGSEHTEEKGSLKKQFLNSGMEILANLNHPDELTEEVASDFEGIGLFRSEFIFMNRDGYPSEEEQYYCYRMLVEKMAPKKVIIRTLDLGDDKGAHYLHLPKEENPALGYRGIRFCLDRPNIFNAQLSALMRAAAYGDLQVLLPMITNIEEVIETKGYMKKLAKEMDKKHIPYKMPQLGVMIETPAAVMILEDLAKEVDFFSIGTNDLAQYTLAADRQSQVDYMGKIYNPHHPAVKKLIQKCVEDAHRMGKSVSICGEMGADLTLLEWFGQIGVDSLSIAPVFFSN